MRHTFIIILFLLNILKCHSQEIKITSPKKGDVWEIGKSYTIHWESTGISTNAIVAIFLEYPGGKGNRNSKIAYVKNSGSYNWRIHSVTGTLGYFSDSTSLNNLRICLITDTNLIKHSTISEIDHNITYKFTSGENGVITDDIGGNTLVCSDWIKGETYTKTAFKIYSPKDKSTPKFEIGKNYKITWDGTKYPSDAKVKITLLPEDIPSGFNKKFSIGETLNTGTYTATWPKEYEVYAESDLVFIIQIYVNGKLVGESNTMTYPPQQ